MVSVVEAAVGRQSVPATSVAERARSAAWAVAACVFTEFMFDVAFSIARGTSLNLGYVGVCGLLMAAMGIACVLAGAALPGTGLRVALTLYVAVHGAIDPETSSGTAVTSLVMGAITWLLLAPDRFAPRRVAAVDVGGSVGAALCVALALWPYAENLLGISMLFPDEAMLLPRVFAFAFTLAAAWSWEWLRGRAPVLLSSGIMSWMGLVAVLACAAYSFHHLRPQSPAETGPSAASAATLPEIFVLVLDTVRADHLASYGYSRDTTPNLRRFLSDQTNAVQYDLALSPASWTVPAHASLLTGLMPSSHRARSRGKTYLEAGLENLRIAADETLAEILHGAGYCTTAVVANAYLLRVGGLQRGFEAFFQPYPTRPLRLLGSALRRRFVPGPFAGSIKPYPSAESINRYVARMHRECGLRPSFVLANYMEAHPPYLAPRPHMGIFAGDHRPTLALDDAFITDSDELIALKRDRYDESLHHLDARLGELFTALAKAGVLDHSWIFITSDHGESFGEHSTTSHGSSIYNEQVRIPLIVKPPRGVELPRTEEPVSLLDVTTTIAAIAGREGFGVGRDLRRPTVPGRPIGIEFTGRFRNDAKNYGATAADPARAVVIGNEKLLVREGSFELYDLANDPRELADRGRERPERVAELTAWLPIDPAATDESPDATTQATPERALDPDAIEELRALGYLH